MAEKKKELTPEQAAVLKSRGLIPEHYIVLQDYPNSILVRNTVTREPRIINKKDPLDRIRQ